MSWTSHLASALALGVGLGLAPGPVQVLLLAESSRGGVVRGLRVMAGVTGTFLVVLAALAFGLAAAAPGPTALSWLRVLGGGFLLYLAADGLRAAIRPGQAADAIAATRGLDPSVRGLMAVATSPGAWVFFLTTAATVVAQAADDGGRGLALAVGVAMAAGATASDLSVVLLGTGGRLVLGSRALRTVEFALAIALGTYGAFLVWQGAT